MIRSSYFVKQNLITASVGLFALIAVQITSQPSEAQLKAWDDTNEVLVDLSVLSVRVGALDQYSITDISLPSLDGRLLDPPKRMPLSKLLTPRPPHAGTNLRRILPEVKLTPPGNYRKRGLLGKGKISKKIAGAKKPPVNIASQQTRQPRPTAKRSIKAKKGTKAPVPRARPIPKVIAGKALPSPRASSRPPAAPELARALPPKYPTARNAKGKPNTIQQASLPTESKGSETVNVLFASGASTLTSAAQKYLTSVADQLKANKSIRLQLLAYAGEPDMSASKARRLSLSRALAVRSYLIKQSVRSTRIDVRALGNKVSSGQPSRVDLKVLGN